MFFKKRKKLKQIKELISSKQNEIDLLNKDLVCYREELKAKNKQAWNYKDIENNIKTIMKKKDKLKKERKRLEKELKVLEG